MSDFFKRLCMEHSSKKGNRIEPVARPTGEKKPEQDIMLFVKLVQKKSEGIR